MAHRIREIKGMDDAVREKLEADGIMTVEQLLAQTDTGPRKSALAKKLGIQGSQLTELINRADLMRLDGVSAALADLLENAGVDTVRELAQRNAANLAQKLQEAAGGAAPSEETIAAWIAQAKTLAPAVTH